MDGMRARAISIKTIFVLALMLISLLLSSLTFSHAVVLDDENSEQQSVSSDNTVLVASDFQFFDITLDNSFDKICIIAFHGDSIPDSKHRSIENCYKWEYDNGVWKDVSGHESSYIKPLECSRQNNTFIFCIGIDKKARPGCWTVKVIVDDDKEVSSSETVLVVAGFNLFLPALLGVFEPCVRSKKIHGVVDFICSDKKRALVDSEKNVEERVDEILRRHETYEQKEKPVDGTPDYFIFYDKKTVKDESAQSIVSTYHRSKLKAIVGNAASSLFFVKNWGRIDGFRRFFAVLLAFILLSVAFIPFISSSDDDDNSPQHITIINVQSYPTVGGKWAVMFTTIGKADLTITAVNGTTWSDTNENNDLRFLELRCGNETLHYEWVNNSIYIANFSCDETCYETSKVLTLGKHHLEFDFGGIKAYAHNSAGQDFKIQRGSTSIAVAATTATITAGTDYDAPTGEAFIRIVSTRLSGGGYTGGGGAQPPDHHMVTISNPENLGTSITFERSASDPTWDTYFEWEIIEYVGSAGGVNEIKVRNASTITVSGASATTGMISGIADDNDVVVFITGQRTDGSANGNVDQGLHTAQWNSVGDTATFTRDDSTNNGYVSYAVVEFTGSNWKIQRVTHQQTATGPQTENLGTQLEDINKTFLHVQTRTNSGNLDEQGVETWISSTTQLSFQRDSLATATQNVVAWVIENNQTYGTPMSVEHVSGSRGTTGSEPDVWTETITTVNAMNSTSIMGENARSTGSGTLVPRGNIQLTLTDTSTVTLWTSDNGQTQNYRFSVVQWPTTDKTPPTSNVNAISPYWYNTSPLTVTATASDNGGTGVKNVTLYWYNSTDNSTWNGPWNFGTDTVSPWSWNFNFPNGTGYYRFYSIAADNASNTESFTSNDTMCGYDTVKPSSQVDAISPYWQSDSDNPLSITVTSPSDDLSGVKNISLWYRYRGDNGSGWSSWMFFGKDDGAPWSWSFDFPDGDSHYQFYSRTNDTVGNLEDPPTSPEYDTHCGYDTINPSSQVDSLSQYWYNESDNPLSIYVSTATDTLSGVKNVTLYYRHRVDNDSSWEPWESYGADDTFPWSWSFIFPDGGGHYQFYSIACDNASNYEDPPVSPDNDTRCGYETDKPSSEVDIILPYWQIYTPLIITGQATDFSSQGLKNVSLYYFYSPDNDYWNSATLFSVDNDPWNSISWNFNFPDGGGYYRFYSIAADNDSNVEDFTGNDTQCGYDISEPSSQVDSILPYWQDEFDNPLTITVTSPSDDLSGVKNLSLYYRYRPYNTSSWSSWTLYGTDENPSWSWSFNFLGDEGHYQFYSIANDNAGNQEAPPTTPENDTGCGYNEQYDLAQGYWVQTTDSDFNNGTKTDINVSNDAFHLNESNAGFLVDTYFQTMTGTDHYFALNRPVSSTDRAFVLVKYYEGQRTEACGTNGLDPSYGEFSCYLYNTTHVRCQRGLATNDIYISCQVIEAQDEEFIVYRGSQAFSGATLSYSPGIGATVTAENSMAWMNGLITTDTSTDHRAISWTADVEGSGSQSTVTLRRDSSSGGHSGTMRWIVVEWNVSKMSDFELEKGTTTLTTQTYSSPQTVAVTVDKSTSILLFQLRTSGDDGLNTHAIAGNIYSDTELRFYVQTSTSYARTVQYYVIDFGTQYAGGVGSKQSDYNSGGTGCSFDQTLSPSVDTTGTLTFVSATCNGDGTLYPRPFFWFYLSSGNTLEIERRYSGQTSQIEWQVLELPYTNYVTSGNLVSEKHDTGSISPIFINLILDSNMPSGTSITAWVRAASTESALDSATWYSDISSVPHERWVQWRINLTGDGINTPTVYEANLIWNYDDAKPSSSVDTISPYWQNIIPMEITATASDDGTGIKEVALYYNYSADNATGWTGWTLYGTNDTNEPFNWSFTPPHGDGYYRFYSIATDNSSLIEDLPADYDTRCGIDVAKPNSQVDDLSSYWFNESGNPLQINVATATDSLSGISDITLYYRYRIDNDSGWGTWESSGTDEDPLWTWDFIFPDGKGHYQFYSIAADNASNYEDPPTAPDNDTRCGYNSTKPSSKLDDITQYWYNTSPVTITGEATDFSQNGLKNVTLYYHFSSDNVSWDDLTLYDADNDPWNDISWNFNFPNGTGYYRFYSIAADNSTPPGIEDFTGNDTQCGYDISEPSSQVDSISPYWQTSIDNPLTVTEADPNDDLSGIKNISLYYRYRPDNGSSWSDWTSFDMDEDAPWSWGFAFPDSDGHYQFYSIANDSAGNQESPPTGPDYDTFCGYDSGKPNSYVEIISPYNQTTPTVALNAQASNGASGVKNVTLWYRYSEDNNTWEPGKSRIKVQKIIGSLSGSTSKTETIEPVNSLNRAFIIYEFTGQSSSDDTPGEGMSCAYFSAVDTITIEKSSSAGGSDYSIYVIECLNEEFIVRKRGSISLDTTETLDTDSVSGIKDISKVFISSSQRSDGSANDQWYRSYCTVELTDANTVTTERSASGVNVVLRYEIVEWLISGVTVQTKEKTLTSLGTSEQTDNINDPVDTSRSFVYATFRHSSDGLSQTSIRYRLAGSSTVGFMRGGGSYDSVARWWVIQFPANSVTVNRGTGSAGTPNDIIDVLVPSCNLSHSFPISCGSNSGTGNAFPRGRYYANLSSETNLRLVCGYSGNTQYYAWQVINTSNWKATGYNWSQWDDTNNPDESSPWQWTFDYPNGTGYYQFYSIATDNVGIVENPPNENDTGCYYNPYAPTGPVINSYNLNNNTGSKLNNDTSLLDVNNEYWFTINITDSNGWVDIEYIEIKAWYDHGDDSSTYNQTGYHGGNLNMHLQYVNTTGIAEFKMLWPDDEAQIVLTNCTETIINSTTRIINISFIPGSQIRWASSNDTWIATQNTTNDLWSWNFNITVIDQVSKTAWVVDEYGIYRYTCLLPISNWVDVLALPGSYDNSNIVTITYLSNYDYNMSIYFEKNLYNKTWDDTILIADNVDIKANADPNDDITEDITFQGIGEANAVDIFNTSGDFQDNGTSQSVQVQFKVSIPFGTLGGKYTAKVATKIFHD